MTRRTLDELVIEEGAGTNLLLVWLMLAFGVGSVAAGWTTSQPVMMAVGSVLIFFAVRTFLFSRTKTHRFDRRRRVVVVESKGRSATSRRELMFDSIKDVVVERGRQSYYLYYVTVQGERIRLADSYDGNRQVTLECFNAAREFLGLPAMAVA